MRWRFRDARGGPGSWRRAALLERASGWPRARRRFAALATAAALLTGAAGGLLGGPEWARPTAIVYVLAALGAIFAPAAITVQVVAGQILAALVLVRGDGAAALVAIPLAAGVVLTAELLAAVARLDSPLAPAPSRELQAAGLAAAVAVTSLGVVLVIGGLRGPTGLAALLLGVGAAAGMAFLLRPPRAGAAPLRLRGRRPEARAEARARRRGSDRDRARAGER